MAWHGARDIPVELNEPHHWAMRDAPDVVSVVASYLSAYNARALGVRDYIAQYMFNSPPGLSDRMDWARYLMLKVKAEKVETPASPTILSAEQVAMFSQGFKPEDFYARNEGGALFTSWDALIAELRRVCPRGKVAVIPCSAIQVPEIV